MKAWVAHEQGIPAMGPIPDGVTVEVFAGTGDYPSDPATVRLWTPTFLSTSQATAPLHDMPELEVLQLLTAGVDVWAPIVPKGVTLCNARGVHTASTAEWAVTATLAALRGFDRFALAQSRGEWEPRTTTSLAGKRVLIIGAGDIGTAIARRVEAFDADVTFVASRARDGVHGVDDLPTLLPHADVVILIVPLTQATTRMVDRSFLSAMRDGALLVNAARGPVVDTDALVDVLAAGRIRAALDVTDPEPLPAGHPLWTTPNTLLTPHVGGAVDDLVETAYTLVGDQLRRWAEGRPLRNVIENDY